MKAIGPGNRAALNLATFDRAWSLVADTHWDPDLGGIDWAAVRAGEVWRKWWITEP